MDIIAFDIALVPQTIDYLIYVKRFNLLLIDSIIIYN